MNTPFITSPAVFAAGRCYQIMAVTDTELLYWVEINGKNYYDASNGVMRSACRAHRAVVPMEELDKAAVIPYASEGFCLEKAQCPLPEK